MKQEHFLTSLFFLISAIIFYLFYQIIIPFFVPIAWAAVFAIIFYPLYQRITTKVKSDSLSSLIVCGIIVLLIIGPMTYLFAALVNEAFDAVAHVNALSKSGELDNLLNFEIPVIETVKEKLAPYYDISKINLDEIARNAINKTSAVVFTQSTWLVANATRTIFYFALMIFAMYYFFKDGEDIILKMKRLFPLSKEQIEVGFSQLRDVIQATMYGGVAIALLQGVLGGILFLVMGISSPVFWGALMAFLALIPIVGASMIYIPAGLIFIVGGSYVKGIIVILIGGLIISQVDNVLRPYLISGRTSLHPMLLFFTIMGGIAVFGLLGLVMGPMIAAAFTILLKVFDLRLHPEDAVVTEETNNE